MVLVAIVLPLMRFNNLFLNRPPGGSPQATLAGQPSTLAAATAPTTAPVQPPAPWDCIKFWEGSNFSAAEAVQQTVYVIAVCFYAAMWAVYFGSKPRVSNHKAIFNVQSLRKLLSLTSVNFSDQMSEADLKNADVNFGDAVHKKASSSQTSLGMLIAVATLELNFISNGLGNLPPTDSYLYRWQELTLSIAALGAILAIVAFIISVDSLDCLFNGFVDPLKSQKDLPYLFYRSTINWRYLGLISILFVASLVVAARNPLFGATSLTVIIGAGYHHWFPYFHEQSPANKDTLVMSPRFGTKIAVLIGAISPMTIELARRLLVK